MTDASTPAAQAQAEITRLTSGADASFTAAYTNPNGAGHAEAVNRLTALHQAAHPHDAQAEAAKQGVDIRPPVQTTALQTPAEMLRNNPKLASAYLAGDAEARKTVEAQCQATAATAEDGTVKPAAPPSGDQAEKPAPLDTAAQMDAPSPLPFEFSPDTPAAVVAETHKTAEGMATALGFVGEERDLLRGAVTTLQKAVAARGEKPMDGIELAKMEHMLHERFGADYDAKIDAVQRALKKLGPKGGEWLRRSILASGPATATWAFESLARKGA